MRSLNPKSAIENPQFKKRLLTQPTGRLFYEPPCVKTNMQ